MADAIKVGARSSELSIRQASAALERLSEMFPGVDFDVAPFTTPGDRDKKSDLRVSDSDFFTRDLDEAVLRGEVDCAIHSAKDLPYPVPSGLDWFWLPWRADRRDALVARKGMSLERLPGRPVVGVSSDRRAEYAERRFPGAELKPVRGNIRGRLEKLDAGEFDILIMAVAGLERLGLEGRVSESVPLDLLPTPPGQGVLALTFKEGSRLFASIRSAFVRAAAFVGSGPGDHKLATLSAVECLESCDVCLYDALSPEKLLDHLSDEAERIYVGKRAGRHSMDQAQITELIAERVRRGERVVRLKGGDPGVFGRLAEELELLDRLELPYRIVPGVSALSAATTGTGLPPTRRGVSRSFTVATPRKSRSAGFEWISEKERASSTLILFMASKHVADTAEALMAEGRSGNEPTAVVYAAGTADERVVASTLSDISGILKNEPDTESPGIVIVGGAADARFLHRRRGAFSGGRVLLTCSEGLAERAATVVRWFGGVPVVEPLVRIEPDPEGMAELERILDFDWVVVTSPAAATVFLDGLSVAGLDIRGIPKLLVAGPGTARVFEASGIRPDVVPESDFGAAGVRKIAETAFSPGCGVARVASNIAPSAEELFSGLGLNLKIADFRLYRNAETAPDTLPEFNHALFASSSAVRSFASSFGADALKGKNVAAIGRPTATALAELEGIEDPAMPPEPTIEAAVDALARRAIRGRVMSGLDLD